MACPNSLIFVDFPSTDPGASAEFYAAVFVLWIKGGEKPPIPAGWTSE
ncbi:MAG: hypothetical protein M3337_07420 [Actinomycetota bacterium]|nr:hypothetical protein [Actinomycetota bacterium]